MARKRQATIRQEDKATWVGFVDRRMDDDELAGLDNWKPKPTEAWELVDRLVSEGYRLTISYNKNTGLASCTIIDDNAKRKSGGYALASSDDDCALALKMALFKHFTILLGNWEGLLTERPKARRG